MLFACGVEAAFIVFLAVFLFKQADPLGDGMEMVFVGFAFMLIFLPFTLPALILARNGGGLCWPLASPPSVHSPISAHGSKYLVS